MKSNNQKIGILALFSLKGIGPSYIRKYITSEMFLKNDIFLEIKNILSKSKKDFDDTEVKASIENANIEIERCANKDIEVFSIFDEQYPLELKLIKDPPPILYCKGNLQLLKKRKICIIGTREPNENGKKIAEKVGKYFVNNNWSICNGLAEGIDNFSIKENHNTHSEVIGILAGGLNFENKSTLLKSTKENAIQVLKNDGLLISEVSLDKKEDTFSVIKSCRLQAGISNGLILIQSSLEGGSRFAMKTFCELPKPVAIINPIKQDFDLITYNANKEIIINQKQGLSKFTELKKEKILTSEILILKSKEDYPKYENLIFAQKKLNNSSLQLF